MKMITFYLMLLFFAQEKQTSMIEFGNGGGFAGTVNTYRLYENGNLYKVKMYSDELELLQVIDKTLATDLFDQIEGNNLCNIDMNKPGNTYKFIHLHNIDQQHRIVWSGKSPNNALNLFYKQLKSLSQSN